MSTTADATRPEGVKNTTILMVLILCLEVVLMAYSLIMVARLAGTSRNPFFSGGIGLISMSYSLLTFLIAAVFVYFYWQGQNVARWAVLIDSGWVLLQTAFAGFTLFSFHSLGRVQHSTLYMSFGLNGAKCALALYFFWYLNQPTVKAWFLSSEALPVSGGAMYPPAPYAASTFPPPVQAAAPLPVSSIPTAPQDPISPRDPPAPPPAGTGFTV